MKDYVEKSREKYVDMLRRFCNQPSIAVSNTGMREMADIVKETLAVLHAEVCEIETPGYPIIYGEIDAGRPRTVTFYNHYDVQPPEPLNEWRTDPFRLTVSDGRMYARGVADNKGSLLSRICAVDACCQVWGSLPVNVKFIIEGEEEIGSPNLSLMVSDHPEKLKTDGLIWEGGSRYIDGPLQIALGVKGLCYVELSLSTANDDMHSQYASIVPNPAWRLTEALSTLKSGDRITIDGFYDDVGQPADTELRFLESMYFDEEALKVSLGLDGFTGGLRGMDLRQQHFLKPTCNICGLSCGYTGQGAKTVLPCRASAKLDMRLVGGQRPERIANLIRQHLSLRGFDDIKVELLAGKPPYRTDPDSLIARAAIDSAADVYGMEPAVYMNLAGTTAMYDLCQDTGIPAVLFGVCNDDSRLHAPNENIFVKDYLDGIRMTAEVLRRFSEM